MEDLSVKNGRSATGAHFFSSKVTRLFLNSIKETSAPDAQFT